MWRLRNRLIVTYVFIGVIPAVLLVTMGVITLYGLGGQFAVYVVTSEIHAQLRSILLNVEMPTASPKSNKKK